MQWFAGEASVSTTSGRRLPRNVASRQSSGLFLRKPENAWVSAPIGTWSGRRLPPEACREDDTVRKWCADAYCLSTNCGGRVHRGVISGSSEAQGATLGGLGGREPPERPFLPLLFPRGKRRGATTNLSIIKNVSSRIGR